MFNFFGNIINNVRNQYFLQPGVNKEVKIDFTNNLLPTEISLIIFSYLNGAQLINCFLTNKTWKQLASNENLWAGLFLREKAFGKKKWETYFGDIGKEPPLPHDIYKILSSPCPFFPGKSVRESHILVLIPETVNGKPLNLTFLQELLRASSKRQPNQYGSVCNDMLDDQASNIYMNINQATPRSHWALMTKDVIPNSSNKSYTDQHKMIAGEAEKTKINYELPNVRDTTICIFMHHISSDELLFRNMVTLCQESTQSLKVAVCGCYFMGVNVSIRNLAESVGVAALRKFF